MEMTAYGHTLGKIKIKRAIFQGESLSPVIFVVCIIPLSSKLRKMKVCYISDNVNINNLLFMEDLKMF